MSMRIVKARPEPPASEAPAQTTQQVLDAANQQRDHLCARREELERAVVAKTAEIENLAASIVNKNTDALRRSRELNAEISDIDAQKNAIETVLKSASERITQLSAIRRKEIQEECFAEALDRVAGIEDTMIAALTQMYTEAGVILGENANFERDLQQLRVRDDPAGSGYFARAVAQRNPLGRISAVRTELLNGLTEKHGGPEKTSALWPTWLLKPGTIA